MAARRRRKARSPEPPVRNITAPPNTGTFTKAQAAYNLGYYGYSIWLDREKWGLKPDLDFLKGAVITLTEEIDPNILHALLEQLNFLLSGIKTWIDENGIAGTNKYLGFGRSEWSALV